MIVLEAVEVVSGGPVWVEEHPPPSNVTVTVTAATVETTVVVDHEVTVDAGHCELVVDDRVVEVELAVELVVLLVSVTVVEEPPEVVDVVPVLVEDEVVDELKGGRPHSSKLWPFSTVSQAQRGTVPARSALTSSQHHTLPPNSCQAQ